MDRVCFHSRRVCRFCGVKGRAVPRARLHCPCCGRFVKRNDKIVNIDAANRRRCPRCTEHGFVALTLFDVA